jgi:hypothetical protein
VILAAAVDTMVAVERIDKRNTVSHPPMAPAYWCYRIVAAGRVKASKTVAMKHRDSSLALARPAAR